MAANQGERLAKIIPLFAEREPAPVTCDECQFAAFGQFGLYCWEFKEEIQNHRVAMECVEFLAWPDSK